MKPIFAAVAATLALACAGPALAHHSFAMFDANKTLTLEGVVKEVQWTNPHIWVQVLVKDRAGRDVEWSLEGTSPNIASRTGWKRNAIKAGDRISVGIKPLRDGSAGGSIMQQTLVINGAKP